MSMISRRSIALLGAFLLMVSFAAHPATGDAPENALVVQDCSYGDAYQFAPASCRATLENVSAKALSLTIVPVQPGTSAEPDKLTLQPHAKADVELHALTDNVAGG